MGSTELFLVPESLHNYIFRSNHLKDLFLKYHTVIPSTAAVGRFFFTRKDEGRKGVGLSDDHSVDKVVTSARVVKTLMGGWCNFSRRRKEGWS